MFLINDFNKSIKSVRKKFHILANENKNNKINRYILETMPSTANPREVNDYFNRYCNYNDHITLDATAQYDNDCKTICYNIHSNINNIVSTTTYMYPLTEPSVICVTSKYFPNIIYVVSDNNFKKIIVESKSDSYEEEIEGLSSYDPLLWNEDDTMLLRLMGELESNQ